MDGNFKAEHLKPQAGDNDVSLSDGTGFMVTRKPYQDHLKAAIDDQTKVNRYDIWYAGESNHDLHQKSGCSNHRAIGLANAKRSHLDITGIGACACAGHGFFIPHCVVDFQKGERYGPNLVRQRFKSHAETLMKADEYGLLDLQRSLKKQRGD